ncbi:MAG: hypothetical protein NTV70_24015 [Acidobacteria bacterium]|nr:hypothetical protein [Acidobacteriota bacterium]
MDVQLNPEQVVKLSELALATGRGTDDLLREAVDNLLSDDQWFRQQVALGLAQSESGDLIEEAEMDLRVKSWFLP